MINYDSLGRITGIAHSRQDKILADYHYKWDAANRITEINDDKYGYDKTNQLLSAVYAKKPKEQYAYDLNGNRLTALLQGQEKKYETGNFNRLLSENGEKLEYDAEGNRIAKGDVKYHWDHRNRLVKVVSPSETVEYTYDYQNRLVSRKTEKGKEYFVHDGWQIALILNGNGSVKERLLWGTHQDELLAQGEKFMLNDHLNTVRDVISADGKIIAHYDYNAFGKQLNASSDTLQFAYTGKLTDSATGLQWNINRWYDANVGKWISEDPIGFKGEDVNLTRYVGNSPDKNVDTMGNKVYAIDGTWSSSMSSTHVKSFYNAVTDGYKGQFSEGPENGTFGSDAPVIVEGMYRSICLDFKYHYDLKKEEMEIDLVGWSRGAVSVVMVARKLNSEGCKTKCKTIKPVKVRWMGLFDAVNMTPFSGWSDANMPTNVSKVYHAKKYGLSLMYPTLDYLGSMVYARYIFKEDSSPTTHGEIGVGWIIPAGEPGAGTQSYELLNWIKSTAQSHGVPVI